MIRWGKGVAVSIRCIQDRVASICIYKKVRRTDVLGVLGLCCNTSLRYSARLKFLRESRVRMAAQPP